MSAPQIEKRLTALGRDVARLKKSENEAAPPWWRAVIGTFANDRQFELAMKLGREYRESLRAKSRMHCR